MNSSSESSPTICGFTSYQWLVLFAAWLGWGFDVFDALLFNYVARLCIPSLLGISTDNVQEIGRWTGILTSMLLIGWAFGGIVFGVLTDKIGRSRALLVTMLTYALATAACAFAPNIWVLLACRFIASLGIGGEWAAGASLVAETVPEKKRVQAGALLYTAAPAGLFLATFVTDLFTRQLDWIASDPHFAWRAVFLTGLIPAAAAILIRLKIREPEGWTPTERPKLQELFTPEMRSRTIGGLAIASIALITWWSCNAFIPFVSSLLANDVVPAATGTELSMLKAKFTTISTTWFNIGGLIGTLLTIPIATYFGRRPMFAIYFLCSAAAIYVTFRIPMPPEDRLRMFFLLGLTVFGVFGAFTFYLPELFPSRLRGTGSGFCYNTGRLITAAGPFMIGQIMRTTSSSHELLGVVSWVGLVPLFGILLLVLGIGHETRELR